ncbi:threonine/serine exporter family protein [Corynebacterium sp. HMSC036E10]|uniref:threonine/serine exporter family protein n=1 Tax=Corynebacterium sp. HMSC036E10 TaxID=1715215 RepID=UPI00114C89A0|nr:threonine/serine exporter family protein [Corynebacterium sp. HMSC036E10]
MESNKISKEEARAALEQIDGIEQDARKPPTPPWAYAILGTSFGVTIAGTIIGWKYWWALFTVIIIACIALAVRDHNRNVRPSMKQPIQEDPKTNWAAALTPAFMMPLIWFVPEGSVVGGVIAGVVTAIVVTAVMIYESRNR